MKKTSLEKMTANHKGKVVEILGGVNLQNRLMNMGIYKGREVTKLGHIGLKGPVIIKTGRSILALGHGMAAKIIIGSE
jgi:Fe2+ transport system protein FeoA